MVVVLTLLSLSVVGNIVLFELFMSIREENKRLSFTNKRLTRENKLEVKAVDLYERDKF